MLYALVIQVLFLPAQDDKGPVAMVLEVKGTVTRLAGKSLERPAQPGDLLRPGDRLRTGADGQVVVRFLKGGQHERVKAKAEVTVGKAGCTPGGAVERRTAVLRGVEDLTGVPELARSGRASATTLRDPALPKVPPALTPLFGDGVLTRRPALSWRPVAGAVRYRVSVHSKGMEGARKPLWAAETKEPHLPYPAKEKALRDGTIYLWTVEAFKEKGEEPATVLRGKFYVVTDEELAELAGAKKLAESKEQGDLVLAAAAYQTRGLYGEALALYERLAKLAPEAPQIQAALADHYERAGRFEEAKAAMERAKKLGYVVPGE